MKTKEELEEAIKDTIKEYKDIIFDADTPTAWRALDELRKQRVYDQKLMDDTVRKLTWEGLQKNMVMGGDMMTDRRKGEVLDPEVGFTYWKDKF